MNDSSGHISTDLLVAYVERRLTGDTLSQAQGHLDSGCPECLRELSFWRRLAPALEAQRWPAPPLSVRHKAVKEIRQHDARGQARRLRFGWAWAAPLAATIALVVFLTLPFPQGGVAFAASLEALSGEVQVRLSPAGEWTAASGQVSLPLGAEIRTGPDGRATLVFPDRNRILLGGTTSLTLDRVDQSQGRWQIKLSQLSGTTHNLITIGTNSYRIVTPAGELHTTGGQFDVEANQDGSVEINVDLGEVSLAGPGGVILVSAGQAGSFPSASPSQDNLPTEPAGNQGDGGQQGDSGEQGESTSPSP